MEDKIIRKYVKGLEKTGRERADIFVVAEFELMILLDVHGSLHHSINRTEITNKMQPCTMFLDCSTCFGRHAAYHREPKNCNCSLWFYIRLWLPAAVKAEWKLGSHSALREAGNPVFINPLNPELNTICYLLALLGAHRFLHVSRIRVKSLTLRRLMSCIHSLVFSP